MELETQKEDMKDENLNRHSEAVCDNGSANSMLHLPALAAPTDTGNGVSIEQESGIACLNYISPEQELYAMNYISPDQELYATNQECHQLDIINIPLNEETRRKNDIDSKDKSDMMPILKNNFVEEVKEFGENDNGLKLDSVQDDELKVCKEVAKLTSDLGFHFNDLPEELIHKIFTYLTIPQLCHSVALVCELWQQLAYDPIHWQKLEFDTNIELNIELLENILSRAALLKTLCLHACDVSEEVIYLIASSCHLLRELDLGFVLSINCQSLGTIANHLTGLVTLNVEGCSQIDHKCIQKICRIKTLKKLNLSHCMHVMDDSVSIIAKQLPNLQDLNIDGISWITDCAIHDLMEHAGQRLYHLVIDGAEVTDQSMIHVASSSCLETLKVSYCDLLTDETLACLQNIPTLRVLRLKKGADFSAKMLQCVFLNPEKNNLRNLVHLDLTECSWLDDAGVEALCICCGRSLLQLHLCWCWNVTDVGLEAIIAYCSKLRKLDLLGIDKIRGECLTSLPHKLPHLRHLDLRQCNRIMDDLIVEVMKMKPNLRVINYYGEEFVVETKKAE